MKKILSLVTLLSISLVLLFSVISIPTKVSAQNIGSLTSVVTSGFSFKKDLRLGDTDPDVKELQKVLNSDIDTMVITDEAGGRGKESTYFGSLTQAAVIKFQTKYKDAVLTINGITSADGVVNKATRTKLNLLIGVMSTSNSVGSPQGSGGSVSASTYVAPTVTTGYNTRAGNTPRLTASVQTCQFVELLINIGAIASNKASVARSALGCPAPVVISTQSTMSTCQFVELLINIGAIASNKASAGRAALGCNTNSSAYVDLKINNSNGPITVSANSTVTITWTSSGVTSCYAGPNSKPLSGSQSASVGTASSRPTLTCQTANGSTVSDSVSVNIRGAAALEEDNSPTLLSTSNYAFSSSSATFRIYSSVPTKAYITLRTNSSDSRMLSYTDLNSSRTETITGLTPSTTYYFTIKIKDADNNSYTTTEYNVMTLASTTTATTATTTITSTSTDSSTKSLSIKVGGVVNYSTSVSSSSSSYLYPTISWTSSGYSSCKISSSPVVMSYYESSVAPSGSGSATIYPSLYQGTTTFSLACATGTAVSTLSAGTVSSLTASANLGIATSTMYISYLSDTASTTLSLLDQYLASLASTTASSTASTTEAEGPSPENPFSGVVVSVATCDDPEGITEVIINPCSAATGSVTTAKIYDRNEDGTDSLTKTLSSQIKITIRDNMQAIPSVGDIVLGKAVHDDGLICGSSDNESSGEHVGTVTGSLGASPDMSGLCANSTGGTAAASDNGDDRGARITGGVLTGAVTGAVVGGTIGTFIPIPGATIGGAILGGAIGGAVGGITSLAEDWL